MLFSTSVSMRSRGKPANPFADDGTIKWYKSMEGNSANNFEN